MKRKLIGLGNGSLVVSLPSKYVQKNELKKGNEVELSEVEGGLVLSVHSNVEPKKKVIDIGNLSNISGRYISSLYRMGYDEFEVKFSKPDMAVELMRKMSENTIGLAVINQKEGSITIKDLSGKKNEELGNITRRIWLLILELGDDLLNIVKSSKFDELPVYWTREKTINQFMNYSIRLLNFSKEGNFSYYYFIRRIEGIADNYKELAECILESKSKTDDLIDFLGQVNNLLRKLYTEYYDYKDEECEKLLIDSDKLLSRIKKEIKDSGSRKSYFIYLSQIVSGIKELCSPLIEMRL